MKCDFSVHAVNYPPNPSLDAYANEWVKESLALFQQGSGIDATYVNYAAGIEDVKSIYGASLPRLQALKKQWDPTGKFNYYNPVGGA